MTSHLSLFWTFHQYIYIAVHYSYGDLTQNGGVSVLVNTYAKTNDTCINRQRFNYTMMSQGQIQGGPRHSPPYGRRIIPSKLLAPPICPWGLKSDNPQLLFTFLPISYPAGYCHSKTLPPPPPPPPPRPKAINAFAAKAMPLAACMHASHNITQPRFGTVL